MLVLGLGLGLAHLQRQLEDLLADPVGGGGLKVRVRVRVGARVRVRVRVRVQGFREPYP